MPSFSNLDVEEGWIAIGDIRVHRYNKRLQRLQKNNKRVCYFVNVYYLNKAACKTAIRLK